MMGLYSSLINVFTERSSSFLSATGGVLSSLFFIFTFIAKGIGRLFAVIMNGLKSAAWMIIKFILGIVDAFEYMINEFLGIDSSVQDMVDYATNIETSTSNFVSVLSTTFRALIAVSIVLLIIFTIIAIVRQEYNNATKNSSNGNEKGPMIVGLFKKMLYIFLLPLTMIFILTGVNSILTAFSRAMKGRNNMSIASQILATSTYDSNKYRYYAQQNQRIPIIIEAYNPNNYDPDENELLIKKIQSFEVQNMLRTTGLNISTNNLLTFKESLSYKNNKLSNSVEYGDFYEKFICTPEQYQVMADFVDYAQQTDTKFQIKSIDDDNIDWRYVDSAVFNPTDVSLKINYRDASDLNNDNKTSDSYTIEYSSNFEVTSPVSDALKTIMALLGIDEYSDNLYKTMERDDDYVNLVRWANEKVLIKLTGTVDDAGNPVEFKLSDPTTWSRIDQLIMYEYYHYASNNTFGEYSVEELIEGIELDAAQIVYREYYAEADAYSPERVINCIEINNTYYHVEKDPTQTDSYGNVYYVLQDALDPGDALQFMSNEYSKIERQEGKTAFLRLTGNGTGFDFNINDRETWSYSDQVLIYEFYKDLTYNNELYVYNFSDFKSVKDGGGNIIGGGVEVPIYKITHHGFNGTSTMTDLDDYYILLNGTYYKAQQFATNQYVLFNPTSGTGATTVDFISAALAYSDTYYHNYVVDLDDLTYESKYGISTNAASTATADSIIHYIDYIGETNDTPPVTTHFHEEFINITPDDANFEKYTNFKLQFSKNFDFEDVSTWTYKDYFLFYLYSRYPKIAGNLGLESLRISGVNGNFGKVNTGTVASPVYKYVYQIKYGTCTMSGCNDYLYMYIDIDKASMISSLLINKEVDLNETFKKNNIDHDSSDPDNSLFVSVTEDELFTSDSEVFKFELSTNFHKNSPSNWTMLDYILYSFSSENKIGSIESIQESGYSSVKIITSDDVLYRLGATEDNTYLSLKGIQSLVDVNNNPLNFQTIDNFLKLNIVDYIAKLYNTTSSDLITSASGISNNLSNDLVKYVYEVDKIIEKIINDNGYKLDSVQILGSAPVYTYSSTAKIDDISTWTKIDALIYALTGEIKQSYTSKIILHDDIKYFVIKNYAIDISSNDIVDPENAPNTIANPFKATISDSNILTSEQVGSFDGSSYAAYFNSSYSNLVVKESDFVSSTIKKTEKYVFKFLKSGSASGYSPLEIIYTYLQDDTSQTISSGATFNVYKAGNDLYIEIYSERYNDYCYVKTGGSITTSENLFECENPICEAVNVGSATVCSTCGQSLTPKAAYMIYSSTNDDFGTNIENCETYFLAHYSSIVITKEVFDAKTTSKYNNFIFTYTKDTNNSTHTVFDLIYEHYMGTKLANGALFSSVVYTYEGAQYISLYSDRFKENYLIKVSETADQDISIVTNNYAITSKNVSGYVEDNSSTAAYLNAVDTFFNAQNYALKVIKSISANGSDVLKLANSTFKYTKNADDTIYTAFDIIYNYLKGASGDQLEAGESLDLDVYMKDDVLYVKVYSEHFGENCYIRAEEDFGGDVSIQKISKITFDNTKIASNTGNEYTSFENVYDSGSLSLQLTLLNYNKLDAIIYSITNKVERNKKYTIYEYDGNKYICIPYTINGSQNSQVTKYKYVKVTEGAGGNSININADHDTAYFDEITLSVEGRIDAGDVDTLAKSYYDKYYTNKPFEQNLAFTSHKAIYEYVLDSGDGKLDITNVSPFALILSNLGVLNLKSNEVVQVEGLIMQSATGDYYFKYSLVSGESVESVFIKITDLLTEYTKEQESGLIFLADKADIKYKMMYDYLLLDIGGASGETVKEDTSLITDYGATLSDIKTEYKDFATDISVDAKTTTISNVSGFEIASPDTWTIYNLINYSMTGTASIVQDKVVYVDANDNEYVEVKLNESQNAYIQINGVAEDYLFDKFTSSATSYKKVDEHGRFSPLGILASKYRNEVEATNDEGVQTVIVSTEILPNGLNFYLVKDLNTTGLVVIYGLDNTNIPSKSTNGDYYYLFRGDSDLSNWTVFDMLVASLSGSSILELESKIHIYGNNAYYAIGQQYINLSKINFITSGQVSKILTNVGTAVDVDKSFVSTVIDVNAEIEYKSEKLSNYYFASDDGRKALAVIDDIGAAAIEVTPPSADSGKLYFSEKFDASDYSTWTVRDFIIYYMFVQNPNLFESETNPLDTITNFQQLVNQGYVPVHEYNYIHDKGMGDTISEVVLWFGVNEKGDGVAIDKYMLDKKADIYLTNMFTKTAIGRLSSEIGSTACGVAANKNYCKHCFKVHDVILAEGCDACGGSVSDIVLADPLPEITTKHFYVSRSVTLNANDFIYDNYYYFEVKTDYVNSLTTENYKTIANGTADVVGSLNIKISDDFVINNPSTWTWLDFIILYEFSNINVRHNYFEGMAFNDLKVDSYLPVFKVGNEYIIEINGNYYNLTKLYDATGKKYCSTCHTIYDTPDPSGKCITCAGNPTLADVPDEIIISQFRNCETLVNQVVTGVDAKVEEAVAYSDDSSLSADGITKIRVLFESLEYFVKKENEFTQDYSKTPSTILYSYNNDLYYMSLEIGVSVNYEVNTATLQCNDNYTITKIVREVNWPQKLMNDIQTLYPDLNWSTLIATDGWIDTLGEFTSAHASGEYVSEGNSANITAAGLVLSEFFLSVTKKQEDYTSVHVYEYEPVFDSDTIKALMLAILGEEEYNDLSMQGEIFMEMFNNMFIPVLEDIAADRGIELVDGKVDNFYISVYKAYLATILLSSDMGEYFYKVATRVYAQYTIFDSLASASGDYAAYVDYINGNSDEFGNRVNAFRYGTFHELAIYENSFTGNLNPTFTFNFLSTLEWLYGNQNGVTYSALKNSSYSIPSAYNAVLSSNVDNAGAKAILADSENFKKVVEELNKNYERIYLSSKSKVSDSNIDGNYCFMLDVYWSIRQELKAQNKSVPEYLNNYYDYITGKIKRWYNVSSVSIEAASGYIPDEKSYEKSLNKSKAAAELAGISIYIPNIAKLELTDEEKKEMTLWEKAKQFLKENVTTSFNILYQTFKNENGIYNEYRRAFENVFLMSGGSLINNLTGLNFTNDVTNLLEIMNKSEKGDTSASYYNKIDYNTNDRVDAWTRLISMRNDVGLLLEELSRVMDETPNTFVEGSNARGYRADYDEKLYETAYNQLKNLYDQLDSYVSNQEILDIINKTSITFTLAQFGKNYVTEGYTFSFENKSYTMKSTTSPERLAEYVYGGSFLAQFGRSADYTNSEYNGFIESYKIYDAELNTMKTKLEIWPELRTFVSGLANYTAKLYFMSNMNDLAGNVGDAIKLTDKVNEGVPGDSEGVRTLEHYILDYLMESDLSADTLIRLVFGETVYTLDGMYDNDTDLGLTDTHTNDSDNQKAIVDFYAIANYLEGTYVSGDDDSDGVPDITFVVDDQLRTREMTSLFKRETLKNYLKYVSDNAVYNSYGYYSDNSNTGIERIHIIFKKVISYLALTEETGESVDQKAINLDDINFKELKKILMKALTEYQKNPSENDLENTNRYITLFNLICSQFEYTYLHPTLASTTVNAGTSISQVFLHLEDGKAEYIHSVGAVKYEQELYAKFSIDIPTRDIILTLAGVENRPIEELVGLEYDHLYDQSGNYDEANGDIFIVCTYDESEGRYYPVIARNSKTDIGGAGSNMHQYIDKYGIEVVTNYYDTQYCYPIIAKGVIDAVGYPTAIKIVDNSVVFYRTGIIGTSSVGQDTLTRTKDSAEVTTVGYTKFVSANYSTKGKENKVMFASASSMGDAINADYVNYLIQVNESYSVSDKANFDSISVLDQFSAFYSLETRQFALFILGFATIIPMLFKASAAVLRRILDLIFLVLMGPLAIASTSLNPDNGGELKSQLFTNWKNYLTETLLHVFGYIIAFNIYYILVSTVMRMDLVSDNTMNMIYRVGGLSSIITKDGVNAFMRLVYTLCAAGALETSADLLVNIVTAGKATQAFSTKMSKNVMEDVKKVVSEVKANIKKIKGVINGEVLIQAKDFALESAKSMIPGSAIARGAIHMAQDHKTKKEAKGLEAAAIANGMAPGAAKKMAQKYADTEIKTRQKDRDNKQKSANAFSKNVMGTEMFSKPTKIKNMGAERRAEKAKKKENKKSGKSKKKDKKKK